MLVCAAATRVMMKQAMLIFIATAALSTALGSPTPAAPSPAVHYRTASVDGLQIFYREAGNRNSPVLVLLHGRETSSHEFRDIIPLLAEKYHVVAPDLPGFGESSAPAAAQFVYSFDHLGAVTADFLKSLKIDRYGLIMHDWGVFVGFRLATRAPEKISMLVVQNGIICEQPNKPRVWLDDFWERRDTAAEARLRNSYRVATRIKYHKVGAANPDGIAPESWIADQYHLDQPGRQDIQVELTYDFGHQNAHFAEWQAYLRDRRPPLLVLWGKDSPVYSPSDVDCFKKADPAAQVHMFSGGHFVLDERYSEAARLVLALDPARPRTAVPLIHVRPPPFGQ